MRIKDRDINIELIRSVACLIVIARHTPIRGMKYGWLLRTFFADGVSLFWFIMGYFLFSNGKSFKDNIKSVINKIIFPCALLVIITQICYDLQTIHSVSNLFQSFLLNIESLFISFTYLNGFTIRGGGAISTSLVYK